MDRKHHFPFEGIVVSYGILTKLLKLQWLRSGE
jgi:hypothetical protein